MILQKRLEHQQISKVLDLSHYDNVYDWTSVSRGDFFLVNSQIYAQHYSFNVIGKEIVIIEDLFANTIRRMINMKPFEKIKDNLGNSQNKELQQLLYNRRATPFCVSLLSLVHVNLGSLFLTPIHVPSLSELPKTVHIHTLETKHPRLPSFAKHYQQH